MLKGDEMKLSENIQAMLICPSTKSKLIRNDGYLESAVNPSICYPVIDGIPILISDEKSVFSINDFIKKRSA